MSRSGSSNDVEDVAVASVGITVDTYSRVLPKADGETADTLARVIA